jgi:hypothetical protein
VDCLLSYEELASDNAIWKEHGEENRALVLTKLRLLDADGKLLSQVAVENKAPKTGAEQHEQLGTLLVKYAGILDNEQVSIIEFQITIFVSQDDCPGYTHNPDSREGRELAALRSEHVAYELTTGYRRYISHLLLLINCAARISQWKDGRRLPLPLMKVTAGRVVSTGSPASQLGELHATTEDAWRLLCTFHSVEIAAKRVNRYITSQEAFVLGLQDFVHSLTEASSRGEEPGTAELILRHLYEEKGIKWEIGLRKALEYYIYESLPCMPS